MNNGTSNKVAPKSKEKILHISLIPTLRQKRKLLTVFLSKVLESKIGKNNLNKNKPTKMKQKSKPKYKEKECIFLLGLSLLCFSCKVFFLSCKESTLENCKMILKMISKLSTKLTNLQFIPISK